MLVACRGRLALRTIAACRSRGLAPIVAVASRDQQRRQVAAADGRVELDGATPAETYDCVESIVAAAVQCQADLVHPGCGALAEDPELPRRLALHGIGCVGSSAAALAMAQDKSRTVAAAARLGVPVLPHATSLADLEALVEQVGLPLVVKPLAGCLGSGVQVVRQLAELTQALAGYAGGQGWYAERYLAEGRAVAITVAVDAGGIAVELGERETLLMAGGLKLLDGSPVLAVPPGLLTRIRRDARLLAAGLGLTGVATCEFIVGPDGYFLLEVNPRLAGGYRMCEAQTGLDVVALQLGIATGEAIAADPVIDQAVHCLEARWYLRSAAGRAGSFERLRFPDVPGVTYDCAIEEGGSMEFDPIVVQVLSTGPNPRVAAERLVYASEATDSSGPAHYGDHIAGWLRSEFDAMPLPSAAATR
ncbi:MAG: ATP-grasp domain-containing protein [Actinomycetota bacterium]|nr:ATP-grasp domain-containing protein [Actinomycetota bacterium]